LLQIDEKWLRKQAGLPDFSWYNKTQRGKYTKTGEHIPNGRKMYQMDGL
jgi:hypothetical protein